MKTLLWITANILLFVYVTSVPVSRSKRQLDEPKVVVLNNTSVCVVNRAVYRDGELLNFKDPCEICRCRPPGFACSYVRCAKKDPALAQPNCKLVAVKGKCCPEYQCQDVATEAALIERKDLPQPTEAALLSNDENASLNAKEAEEEVTLESRQPEVTEPPRENRQDDLVTERSDELITGKSDNEEVTSRSDELITGKSEELITGKSEELATGKSDDLEVATAEPPLDGKLAIKNANLILESTDEPKIEAYKATEKEGRLDDEENTAEPEVEAKSDHNQTVEGRLDNLQDEESTEKAPERRRRESDDEPTEKPDIEELKEKSSDDELTPKSINEDLTPKSIDEDDLTPKSVELELTPKCDDQSTSSSLQELDRKRRDATEDEKEAEIESTAAPVEGKSADEDEATTAAL